MGRREGEGKAEDGSQSVLRMSFAHGAVEVVTCEGGVPSQCTLEGKTGIMGRCRVSVEAGPSSLGSGLPPTLPALEM